MFGVRPKYTPYHHVLSKSLHPAFPMLAFTGPQRRAPVCWSRADLVFLATDQHFDLCSPSFPGFLFFSIFLGGWEFHPVTMCVYVSTCKLCAQLCTCIWLYACPSRCLLIDSFSSCCYVPNLLRNYPSQVQSNNKPHLFCSAKKQIAIYFNHFRPNFWWSNRHVLNKKFW